MRWAIFWSAGATGTVLGGIFVAARALMDVIGVADMREQLSEATGVVANAFALVASMGPFGVYLVFGLMLVIGMFTLAWLVALTLRELPTKAFSEEAIAAIAYSRAIAQD